MVKKILFIILLLMIPLVFADSTFVVIKTYPSSEVTVNLLDASSLDTVPGGTSIVNSTEEGIASTSFTTGLSSVAISVLVRKNGKILNYSRYGNYSGEGTINIDMLSESPPASVVNNTLVANNTPAVNNISLTPAVNVSNQNASVNSTSFFSSLSSAFSGTSLRFIGKVVLYALGIIVGIILILVIIWFVAARIKNRRPSYSKEFKKPHEDEKKPFFEKENSGDISGAEKRIRSAQEEIRKAQEEISRIKNRKSEVREAEEKFLQAKRDLERLKGRA